MRGADQDGLAIARQRIACEQAEQTGTLDLGMLGLTSLPEDLFELQHLQSLNLGAGWLDTRGDWHEAGANIAANHLGSPVGLSRLANLQILSTNGCQLGSLTCIANLQTLRVLDCSGTQVSDLGPLASLGALQSLSCWGTPVSGLGPLANLTALQSLDCNQTRVGDLQPLAGLSALRSLSCWGTQVSNLVPLASLSALQSLDCNGTQVSNLEPLADLTSLQSLVCWGTQVADLTPLAGLTGLQLLDCNQTGVGDLGPLASLSALRSLSCWGTQVADLAPLAHLSALESLDCSYTRVNSLEPLADLLALQSLLCSGTQVTDLAPLTKLCALESLYCSETQVSDLGPVANLRTLQSLVFNETKVSDLGPVASLSALESLECRGTHVSDLAPLATLFALKSLDCSQTRVRDLKPLAGLPSLQSLDCSSCDLDSFPRPLLDRPSLQQLVLYESRLPGIPVAILSHSPFESCLDVLRAHFIDLDAGTAAVTDVKLMVLGNGRVGKTQLCRSLRDEPYDETVPSTHGVIVTSASLPAASAGPEARLNIWDFGGQDIYHGTHALFMRTEALFVLAWTPELENAGEVVVDGIRFRNHPLAYWVDYIRHQAGAGSPVIVVQTRCDKPEDKAPCPVPEAALLQAFKLPSILHFSAKRRRGKESLAESLRDAVSWLKSHGSDAVIGVGRYRVQQRLQQMLDTDAALPPEKRQHRKLTQDAFRQLCDEAGGISSREHLLSYLHNAGIVFYRQGLFADDIILDQGWALDAIYAVFHREKSYKRILRRRGRFTRADLDDGVWQDHDPGEQELFLSMMQSCGICFAHRRLGAPDDQEIEYIAPDLLPERGALEVDLAQRWEADAPTETATFRYPMLHPGLMRSITSAIGSEAGIDAEYWKGGVYVYETKTGSRALIEETMLDTWRGEIRIQTQRGQAALLLQRLIKLVEEQQGRAGLTPAPVIATSAAVREPGDPAAPLSFAQEPSPMPEWCVSYAWNDTTPEGRDREAAVDHLCDEAAARGKTILRDKTALGLGDSLAKFMRRIGRGDRVFVILSDKYLKSPACMFELSEIWRNSRLEGEEFVQRVRAFTLPCARIWESEDRLGYAIHWKNRYGKLEDLVKEHGYDILGEKDGQQFRLMKTFYGNVSDILATVADTLQPRTFDDLVKYGFDGGGA